MDPKVLKQRIDSLNPLTHRALREALLTEYRRATGESEPDRPQDSTACYVFAKVFQQAVDKVSPRYIEGTFEYLKRALPDLDAKIDQATDRVEATWQAGLEGKASIVEFQEAVTEWSRLQLEAIRVFSETQGGLIP